MLRNLSLSMVVVLGLLASVAAGSGCGGGARLAINNQQPYFLMTNLRARRNVVSSVNEWNGDALLPVCTQVQVSSARGREIRFTANGQDYRYQIYKRSTLPLEQHFQRIFGTGCPNVQAMTPIEQAGIQRGLPYNGMSKAAVIIAMGYPSDHRTAALEQTAWTYDGAQGPVTANFMADTLMGVEGRPDEPVLLAVAQGVPADVQQTSTANNTSGGQTTQTNQTGSAVNEPMVVVTDANGYPTQVPESAIGKPCGTGQPTCHPGLSCEAGTCQGAHQ